MSTKSKKVLLIAYISSHLNELIRISRLLKKTKGQFKPVILFITEFMPMDVGYLEILKKEKIDLIDISGNPFESEHSPQAKMWSQKLNPKLSLSWQYYKSIKNKIYLAERLFEKIKPDLIVQTEESMIYNTSIFTKTARRYSIRTLIVPYTIANKIEFAEAFYDLNILKGNFSKIMARFYPKWTYFYRNRRLLLLPGWQIIVLELLKLASKNPWFILSSSADAVAVESPHMMKYYLKNGLPAKQLVLTGSTTDDILYKNQKKMVQLRETLNKKLNLKNKPIILCAVLLAEPHRATEFRDYNQIIGYWIKTLTQVKNFNVVFNLHPNLNSSQKAVIEDSGVKIVRTDIAQLIPLCDLYIACVSATIRWAIACAKPVLNYDVYRYRFHDYDEAKGVVTVENKKDFLNYLKRFTEDKIFYQEMVQKQKNCMKEWGMLDGKSCQRMIRLFEDLK